MFYFNSAQIRQIGDQPLKKLLQSLGGWPVLDKEWKSSNQSIEQLVGRLRGEFNEHFLVSILVGPDDKNSSVNILQVIQTINLVSHSHVSERERDTLFLHFFFFLF